MKRLFLLMHFPPFSSVLSNVNCCLLTCEILYVQKAICIPIQIYTVWFQNEKSIGDIFGNISCKKLINYVYFIIYIIRIYLSEQRDQLYQSEIKFIDNMGTIENCMVLLNKRLRGNKKMLIIWPYLFTSR